MTQRYLIAALLLLQTVTPAKADYAPQRGDVLELMVAGAPALSRRLTVDANGDISIPVLGRVRATDVGLAELGQRIQALLLERNVVRRGQTIVTVAEYGPIYVDGDIARPGEYRYRPGMTVRTAIALAGGIDESRGVGRPSPAQLSEARAEYGATAIELARQQARIARLEANLAGAAGFPSEIADTPGVPPAVSREIIAAEMRQMEAERQARANEKGHLERALASARAEVTVIDQAEREQRASYEQAVSEAGRAGDLLQRGVGTAVRIEIAERSLAQARSQLLDVQIRLRQARREVEDRAQQLQTVDDQRRATQLDQLREAVAEASKARFRLQSARERLARRSEALSATDGAEPEIVVRRLRGAETIRFAGELDTALQPGDSVEVVRNDLRADATGLRREP